MGCQGRKGPVLACVPAVTPISPQCPVRKPVVWESWPAGLSASRGSCSVLYFTVRAQADRIQSFKLMSWWSVVYRDFVLVCLLVLCVCFKEGPLFWSDKWSNLEQLHCQPNRLVSTTLDDKLLSEVMAPILKHFTDQDTKQSSATRVDCQIAQEIRMRMRPTHESLK